MAFELYLSHGRKDIEQAMDDWGFDGPRLQGVTGLHQTYGDNQRVVFESVEACKAAQALTGWESWDDDQLTMRWEQDLVRTDSADGASFFGDWGLWLKREGE